MNNYFKQFVYFVEPFKQPSLFRCQRVCIPAALKRT